MIKLAEFLAEVGFKADGASLKSALKQVATFGAGAAAAATGAIAGILKIAQREAQLAADAEKLNIPVQKLDELRFEAEQSGASAEALSSSVAGLQKANPGIKDAEKLLAKAGRAMAGMNDEAAKLYAQKMGIDPSLIPMLRGEVTGLTKDFHAMYAASGRDAAKAAADGKALMQEFGRLKSLFELLAKTVAGAFLGKVRGSFELLRKSVVENFDKIKKVLEFVIGIVLRAGDVIAAFVYRIIKFASAIIGWFDGLSSGAKKLVIGLGGLVAIWKAMSAGFLMTPLPYIIAGLTAIFALIDVYLTWAEGGDSLFDWSEWADSIETVIGVLKVLWDVVCAIGAGLAKAIGPAIGIFKNMLTTVYGIVSGIFKLLKSLFTGDLQGILSAAKSIWQSWCNGVLGFISGLVDTAAAFFTGLWDGVKAAFPDFAADAESAVAAIVSAFNTVIAFFANLWGNITSAFPDFGAWAGKAADSIKNLLGSAIGWVKDKLSGLVSFLPEWVKKKIGLKDSGKDSGGKQKETSGAQDASKSQQAPRMSPYMQRPIPSGPALVPTPMQKESVVNKNTEVKVDSRTQITVNGAQNPEAVAGKVAGAQNNVAADIARHTRGAVR